MHKLPLALFFLSTLSLASCGNQGEVTDIAFTQNAYTLAVGETATLTPILTGGTKAVTYLSTDESVATVDASGLITAVAKGQATIVGICNDHLAKAIVEVTGPSVADKIYQRKGKLVFDGDLPTLGITGKHEGDVTFVYEGGAFGQFYVELPVEDDSFNREAISFLNSSFVLDNPSFTISPALKRYFALLKSAADQDKMPGVSKGYFDGEYLTGFYFYEDQSLGQSEFDFSETVSKARLAISFASMLPALLENPSDIIPLLFNYLDEGESKPSLGGSAVILAALVANASVLANKGENSLDLSLYVDESKSADFLKAIGFDLGEGSTVSRIGLDASFLRDNAEDEFRISKLSFGFDATLNEQKNTASVSLLLPEKKVEQPSDTLEKIKASLPFTEK